MCSSLLCTHVCVCVRASVIVARGAEVSGLCVRGWALFIAVSQVRVKAWAWSSPASSICRRGRSHLSSAELSEHQDGSALPLEMTGLCANGSCGGGAIWSDTCIQLWTGPVPGGQRAREVNGREVEERGFTWMVLPLVREEFSLFFSGLRNLRKFCLLLLTS